MEPAVNEKAVDSKGPDRKDRHESEHVESVEGDAENESPAISFAGGEPEAAEDDDPHHYGPLGHGRKVFSEAPSVKAQEIEHADVDEKVHLYRNDAAAGHGQSCGVEEVVRIFLAIFAQLVAAPLLGFLVLFVRSASTNVEEFHDSPGKAV